LTAKQLDLAVAIRCISPRVAAEGVPQERQCLGEQACAWVDGHDPASGPASDLFKRLGELFPTGYRHDAEGSQALLKAPYLVALACSPAPVQPDPVDGAWVDVNRSALLCAPARPVRADDELMAARGDVAKVHVGGEGLVSRGQPWERPFGFDRSRSQCRLPMVARDAYVDRGQPAWCRGPAAEGEIAARECPAVQARALEPHDGFAFLCSLDNFSPACTVIIAYGAPLAARNATHTRAVIAFGCPVIDRDKYSRFAEPGIRRAAEPDSALLLRHDAPSIQAAYNSMLEEASARRDLEALVLLHEDVELRDADLTDKVRACMRDPLVAVVGAVGSQDVSGLDWWRGGMVGGVMAPALVGPNVVIGGASPRDPVESVDGLLLALSPWAVRTLRFDERFAPYFHGYDVDLCFQARERGRHVVVAHLDVVHYAGLDFFDRRTWVPAYKLWHRKWGRRPALAAASTPAQRHRRC